MREEKEKSTIVTMATDLGVSPSTISRAFHPSSRISSEVRERILRYAEKNHYVPNRAASRLSMQEINIGVVFTDFYPPATDEFTRGIEDGYRELFDLKVNRELVLLDDHTKTAEKLKELLRRWKDYDGLIVSGLTAPDEIELLNRYQERNKNLVLLQADTPGLSNLFVSCHDPGVSSRMAAEFISDCLKMSRSKRVVIFTGSRRSGLHDRANEAFCEAAVTLGLIVTGSYDMQDSPELLRQQLNEVYGTKKLCPDGIYITSGKSLELCRYIKENGLSEKTVLVTFDTYPELNEYLEQGIITATIYQNLYMQAKNAFTNLVKHIIGQINADGIISPAPVLVLKSNLRCYSR